MESLGEPPRLAARVQKLEEEVHALRICTEAAGILRKEAWLAALHRARFQSMRHLHPATLMASFLDALHATELLHMALSFAGLAAAAPVLRTCQTVSNSRSKLQHFVPQSFYVCGGRDGHACLNSVEKFTSIPFSGDLTAEQQKMTMIARRAAPATSSLGSDSFIVCGGWGGDQYLHTAEIYDAVTGSWKAAPDMPRRRAASAAGFDGRRVLICGGWDGVRALNDVDCYDVRAGAWEPLAPLQHSRHGAVVVVAASVAYVCGGHDDITVLNSVERYDTALQQWTFSPSMLVPRHGAVGAALSRPSLDSFGDSRLSLYICGGHDGEHSLASVETFDVSAQKWTPAASMAEHREGAGAVVMHGCLYILGGLNDERRALSSVEWYDPRSNSWESASPMLTSRAFLTVSPALQRAL